MKFCWSILFILLWSSELHAQVRHTLKAEWDPEHQKLNVQQRIEYTNSTADTLHYLILNDWNHAYSDKNSPLGRRFSDEFVRSFHLAKDKERGGTEQLTLLDQNDLFLNWTRLEKHLDLIKVQLRAPLPPGETLQIKATYISKIPSDRFTRFGYNNQEGALLRNWFLTPARYHEGSFVHYSNLNLDDIANERFDVQLELGIPATINALSDLTLQDSKLRGGYQWLTFTGKHKMDFSVVLEKEVQTHQYRNEFVEVVSNLRDQRLNNYQKAIVIDRVTRFASEILGKPVAEKILITQQDYDRNPFYGLNQLPAFISPFPDEFLFEVKFLKTYLNKLLSAELNIDQRKDSWIHDGIQIYLMMYYIDSNYPDVTMMGNLSKFWLTRGYKFMQIAFNEQYSYAYMLMARKNLDQPIGDSKESFIKFNEQIAGKYRAGLSLKYLDNYLEEERVPKVIQNFYKLNRQQPTGRVDFEEMLRASTSQDLDWFFSTIIQSRELIDYKFTSFSKTKDSVTLTLRNKTGNAVPIPIYGVKNKKVVFKEWMECMEGDTVITLARKDADKIVINYLNEVPEYNLRNNWVSLNRSFLNHRPIKVNFFKDLEDPYVNQLLGVPVMGYNLYDGLTPGLRFHNKTFLEKPFTFDVVPTYSTLTQSLIGSASLVFLQNNRESQWYQVRYSLQGSTFHYASDAAYRRINPMVIFRKRPSSFRDNRVENFMSRVIWVDRERSELPILGQDNVNYTIFNAKYINVRTEVRDHFGVKSDFQLSNLFGKLSGEVEYRKLFEDNRQLNLRLFAGTFLYRNTDSDFFSFGLDRPTDYLFDYGLYGRSEETGFFSQQYVVGEGAFKSRFEERFANQWMTTVNASFNIWNWVETYGDAGVFKNQGRPAQFVYDSGIRFNLVTDYFEVYFPVYSSLGWEVGQRNYHERIRFMLTLNPNILVTLFTRKWF
jgi:phenylpyruvate tautomerase PptA (4-oxalocrotonate tautomerase family)